MTPLIQNLLWFAAGVCVTLIIVRLTKSGGKTKKDDSQTLAGVSQTLGNDGIQLPSINGSMNKGNSRTVVDGGMIQSAKEAFLSNIERFIPLLSQIDGTVDEKLWTEQILNINNAQLIEIWNKCSKNFNIWKMTISAWGLRQDTCKSFTYLSKYSNMYELSDREEPTEYQKYKVLTGCWVLTDCVSGEKTVVKKGKMMKL